MWLSCLSWPCWSFDCRRVLSSEEAVFFSKWRNVFHCLVHHLFIMYVVLQGARPELLHHLMPSSHWHYQTMELSSIYLAKLSSTPGSQRSRDDIPGRGDLQRVPLILGNKWPACGVLAIPLSLQDTCSALGLVELPLWWEMEELRRQSCYGRKVSLMSDITRMHMEASKTYNPAWGCRKTHRHHCILWREKAPRSQFWDVQKL